jgi:EmrB/QacA subfamily drug resistance transporter
LSLAVRSLERRFAGARETLRPRPAYRWIIAATASASAFANTLSSGIVNVSLPYMSVDLGAGIGLIQLVVSLFTLTAATLLPVFGRLSDQIGLKRVFSGGFVLFVAGSAACGLADTLPVLLSFRVIQAAGGAMMMATNMALVTQVFPPSERGRALGFLTSMVAIGSMAGPPIGGTLIALFGWRSVFLINVPIGLLGYVAASALLPPDGKTGRREPFDVAGAVWFAGLMISLLTLISGGPGWGLGSPKTVVAAGVMAVALGGFLRRERKVTWPLIDLALFRIPVFALGNIAGLLSYAVTQFNLLLMPFYLQRVMGYPPAAVGLLMVPTPLVMAVAGPLAGGLSDRFGFVIPTTLGMGTTSLALYLLAGLSPAAGYEAVAGRLALLGLGMAVFTSPNNSSILGAVPRSKLGITGSLIATVRTLGMMMGTAGAAALFSVWAGPTAATAAGSASVAQFLAGFSKVLRCGSALAAVGMLLCLVRAGKTVTRPASR